MKKSQLFTLRLFSLLLAILLPLLTLASCSAEAPSNDQIGGLRPGEKLFEELLMKTEQLDKTENDMIFVERDTPYTREEVDEKLRILMDAVRNHQNVHEAVAKVVPTFLTPEQANRNAENSEEMKLVLAGRL